MQLLSHPLTPDELQGFIMNPLAVHMEYSVRLRLVQVYVAILFIASQLSRLQLIKGDV